MSKERRTLGVYSRARPLGPNGEKICYNCGGPLPKGRPYNCSGKCSEEWHCKTSPHYMRHVLFKRDHGVCASCGIDTKALEAEYHELPRAMPQTERQEWLAAHSIPPGRVSTDFWDADHIIPVIEGGGECDLSNFRTLCIPCHKKATKELHARLKQKRVEAAKTIKPEFGNAQAIEARNYLRRQKGDAVTSGDAA